MRRIEKTRERVAVFRREEDAVVSIGCIACNTPQRAGETEGCARCVRDGARDRVARCAFRVTIECEQRQVQGGLRDRLYAAQRTARNDGLETLTDPIGRRMLRRNQRPFEGYEVSG